MRTNINLATKPWVDTGTIMRRLRNALAVLTAVCLLALLGLHFESRKAQEAELQRQQMDAKAAELQREKQNFAAQLQLPQNQAILARAQLLNQIFAGKSFSWTAVMMDLERTLPSGLHVVAVEPQVLPSGDIVVRLRVNGDRDRAVEMVRNLERSHRFRQPRVAEEAVEAATTAPQQGAGGFRPAAAAASGGVTFDILADYNPLTNNEKLATDKTVIQTTTVHTTVHNNAKTHTSAKSPASGTPAVRLSARPSTKPSAGSPAAPATTPAQQLPPLIPAGAAGSHLPRPHGGPARSNSPGGPQ